MAEPEHPKVCLMVKALPTAEPHESAINAQSQHWSPLAAVAREIGDRHAYDLCES